MTRTDKKQRYTDLTQKPPLTRREKNNKHWPAKLHYIIGEITKPYTNTHHMEIYQCRLTRDGLRGSPTYVYIRGKGHSLHHS
jgi:hypothetical protein